MVCTAHVLAACACAYFGVAAAWGASLGVALVLAGPAAYFGVAAALCAYLGVLAGPAAGAAL